MKRLLMILMIMSAGHLILQAQTSMAKPDLSIPSLVAPGYFGPNAFPVPDMSDGTVSTSVKAELYGDCPMTLKARVSWDFGLLSLGVIYSCPASGFRKSN